MIVVAAAMWCLSLNVYHEARGEPLEGQFAVASVTMNRAKQNTANVCKVVYKSKHFSWTMDRNNKITDHRAWIESKQVAYLILNGAVGDKTEGATFYHRDDVSPKWNRHVVLTKRIGRHLFYVTQSVTSDRRNAYAALRNYQRYAPSWMGRLLNGRPDDRSELATADHLGRDQARSGNSQGSRRQPALSRRRFVPRPGFYGAVSAEPDA